MMKILYWLTIDYTFYDYKFYDYKFGAFIRDKKISLLNVLCLWDVVHNMISGTGLLEGFWKSP